MMLKRINSHIAITTLLLFVVIAFFEFTNYDISFQEYFYNFDTKSWFWDKNEPVLKFLLYDGLKKLLILFAVIILFVLIFFRKKEFVQRSKQGLIIVLLSAILVPAIVGSLKAVSNTPCPKDIQYFNGQYPNIKVFDTYPEGFVQKSKIRCWPAGHASGGFALLSLFFLFRKNINKFFAVSFALVVGWSMGAYKMVIGDHFLSHTIITMLLAWIIILIIVKILDLFQRRTIEKSTQI